MVQRGNHRSNLALRQWVPASAMPAVVRPPRCALLLCVSVPGWLTGVMVEEFRGCGGRPSARMIAAAVVGTVGAVLTGILGSGDYAASVGQLAHELEDDHDDDTADLGRAY